MNKRPVSTTLRDLVDFILINRTEKVFTGWTEEQLLVFLEECLQKNLLFYATGLNGELLGIVTLVKREPFKLYIAHALALPKFEFGRAFFKRLLVLWPGTRYMSADRHGKTHEYNVASLKRKYKLL